mmetsp:Transcript_120115/g.335120  ORF Transcript_120115/g.335120 Transcript_120115/m.335120 type:complete len:393 (+) Transcript_120115:149-1327(+)
MVPTMQSDSSAANASAKRSSSSSPAMVHSSGAGRSSSSRSTRPPTAPSSRSVTSTVPLSPSTLLTGTRARPNMPCSRPADGQFPSKISTTTSPRMSRSCTGNSQPSPHSVLAALGTVFVCMVLSARVQRQYSSVAVPDALPRMLRLLARSLARSTQTRNWPTGRDSVLEVDSGALVVGPASLCQPAGRPKARQPRLHGTNLGPIFSGVEYNGAGRELFSFRCGEEGAEAQVGAGLLSVDAVRLRSSWQSSSISTRSSCSMPSGTRCFAATSQPIIFMSGDCAGRAWGTHWYSERSGSCIRMVVSVELTPELRALAEATVERSLEAMDFSNFICKRYAGANLCAGGRTNSVSRQESVPFTFFAAVRGSRYTMLFLPLQLSLMRILKFGRASTL